MNSLRSFFVLAASAIFLLSLSSCEDGIGLTEAEVIDGLRQALEVGTDTSVAKVSQANGYYNHPVHKVLFPEEADVVLSVVSAIPGGDLLIEEAVKKMNQAAEEAAKSAAPIFVDAITNITIEDGFNILGGSDSAATMFLEAGTRVQLYDAFKPTIQSTLESVGAQQAFDEVITLYNNIPLVADVNPDLADHTTNKGLDGLFYEVQLEEGRIRNDPVHRVTELLEKVFEE